MNVIAHLFLKNASQEILKTFMAVIGNMAMAYYVTVVVISERMAFGAINGKSPLVSEIVKSSSNGRRFIRSVVIWDIAARLLLIMVIFAGFFLAFIFIIPQENRTYLMRFIFLGMISSHAVTALCGLFSRSTDSIFVYLFSLYCSIMLLLPGMLIISFENARISPAVIIACIVVYSILDIVFNLLLIINVNGSMKKWYIDDQTDPKKD